MSMPKEWPILEADDFCRGTYEMGDQRCLIGWWTHAGGVWGDSRFYALCASTSKQLGAVAVGDNYRFPPAINDHAGNPKSLLARIWNRVGAKLGYRVGNPECTRSGKLRPVK